jgi:paraquat-inducible protein B
MKRANPAVIGGFVVGAIALIVIGLLAFGGAGWFIQRNTYIAYFPGSVKGLQVGAPVDFRGVTIGQVKQIRVLFDPRQVDARIPVIMELATKQIDVAGGGDIVTRSGDGERLIEAGLGAQLQLQSMLTGLLFVNLDFYPKGRARLVGGDQPYPEIPTIPSDLEQLQESAADIAGRLPDLLDQLNGLLTEVNQALGQTSGDFSSIVSDLAVISREIREATPDVVARTAAASDDIQRVAGTLEELLETNRDAVGAMIDEWTVAASAIRRLADQVEQLMAENREGLSDFTQEGLYEYTGLAQDAQRLVDQITRIADELERDPARFLFGDRAQGIRAE